MSRILCALGIHDPYVGSTGREGFVRFLYCRRSCGWSTTRKGEERPVRRRRYILLGAATAAWAADLLTFHLMTAQYGTEAEVNPFARWLAMGGAESVMKALGLMLVGAAASIIARRSRIASGAILLAAFVAGTIGTASNLAVLWAH